MIESTARERRVVNKLINKAWALARQDPFAFRDRLIDVVVQRSKGVSSPEEAERFAHAVLAREGLDYSLRTDIAEIFMSIANVMRRDGH